MSKYWYVIGLIFIFVSVPGFSSQPPQVALFPLKIYAEKESVQLGKEVEKIVTDALEERGAVLVNVENLKDSIPEQGFDNSQHVRDFGIKEGFDYGVWGSISRIGEGYSVDIKLIDIKSDNPAESFYTEGEKIENLYPEINKIASNIANSVLKADLVAEVLIEGNERIEDDAVKRKIDTKAGEAFIKKKLSNDLKSIYAMGYFDDIRIETRESLNGKIVIFTLKEKPTIRDIIFTGNSDYDDEEITEKIDIRKGSIFNIIKIKREINKIKAFYRDENYHGAKISYNIERLENNQADLEFVIEEGDEALVQKITFEGNETFNDDQIKDLNASGEGIYGWFPFSLFESSGELGEMETEEEGFFSFFTDSGKLDTEALSQDTARLRAFYLNSGFSLVKVGEPQVEYEEDGIFIKIKIEEGPRFKIGKIDVQGDLIKPKDEIMEQIKLGEEEFFNQGVLRKDIIILNDIYADQGYFYADIFPSVDRNIETKTADITYVINKKNLVYFEKIIISGNTSTRDKVIRRELPMVEQDLYSGSKLKRGMRNLYRLDFFEDIKVNTLEGNSNDKMILKIDVEEKPTGAFTFGGGYSTTENLFASFSISERNLFGRGQILKFMMEIGGKTTKYNLSFTEPWMFDIPLSGTVSVYNVSRDEDTYDKNTLGGGLGLGYMIFDYTRLSSSYVYEINEYLNIQPDAPDSVKDLEGESDTSKVISRINYDSRDRVFNATEGSNHSLTLIYAGGPLGGDIGFSKYLVEAARYFPLFWSTVGVVHGEGGYVVKNSDGKLPVEERFHLGGLNTLRGFDWKDVSPTEINEFGLEVKVGGNKYVQFNFEFLFPIFQDAGLMGVLFYDTGNAFNNGESIDFRDLRESAGWGIRWNSPVGPIRIENGYILDTKPGEDGGGKIEFTMGAAF